MGATVQEAATQCLWKGIAIRGEMEIGGEGSRDETDSRRIRVAFGENRRGDKTGRENGTGGRVNERNAVVVGLVCGVRKGGMEDPVWVSEVLEHGAGECQRQPG